MHCARPLQAAIDASALEFATPKASIGVFVYEMVHPRPPCPPRLQGPHHRSRRDGDYHRPADLGQPAGSLRCRHPDAHRPLRAAAACRRRLPRRFHRTGDRGRGVCPLQVDPPTSASAGWLMLKGTNTLGGEPQLAPTHPTPAPLTCPPAAGSWRRSRQSSAAPCGASPLASRTTLTSRGTPPPPPAPPLPVRPSGTRRRCSPCLMPAASSWARPTSTSLPAASWAPAPPTPSQVRQRAHAAGGGGEVLCSRMHCNITTQCCS